MKNVKKLTLLAVALLTASPILSSCGGGSEPKPYEGTDPATILNGYYKSLTSWENYLDLREKLYNIIYNDFEPISYTSDPENPDRANWSTNRKADQSLTNHDMVHLLYSDDEEFKQTGNTSNWQREHCFPASLLTGQTTGEAVKTLGTATDFHNLYASYSSGNSAHSNMSYGYVDATKGEILNAGNARYQEDNVETEENEGVFEPADCDKGRTSRAVFYMAILYGRDSWVKSETQSGKPLSTGVRLINKGSGTCSLHESQIGNKCHSNLADIIEWNNSYWPDRLEYQHTTTVQSLQHNRNPFVDFPELVDYCFGDKMSESGELKHLHNIHDILSLGSDDVADVAVKNVKYSYDAGETFNAKNDLEVYTTTKSFKETKVDNFSVSGVTDGEVLSSSKNGSTVSVSVNNAKADYKISVANEAWQKLNIKCLPTATNLKGWTASNDTLVTLDGVTWKFSTTAAKSISVLDENCKEIGVGVGSSASPAETITIESLSPIKKDDAHVVKKIFIEANAAKKYYSNFDLEIFLDGKSIGTKSCTFEANSTLTTHGFDLSPLKQGPGKVKIVLSNIAQKINLGRIGLLVEKSSD